MLCLFCVKSYSSANLHNITKRCKIKFKKFGHPAYCLYFCSQKLEESNTDNPFVHMNNTEHRYAWKEEILPTANEDIVPIPVVQVMQHPRMDLSRGISEEELMARMQTRLKAMFS